MFVGSPIVTSEMSCGGGGLGNRSPAETVTYSHRGMYISQMTGQDWVSPATSLPHLTKSYEERSSGLRESASRSRSCPHTRSHRLRARSGSRSAKLDSRIPRNASIAVNARSRRFF